MSILKFLAVYGASLCALLLVVQEINKAELIHMPKKRRPVTFQQIVSSLSFRRTERGASRMWHPIAPAVEGPHRRNTASWAPLEESTPADLSML